MLRKLGQDLDVPFAYFFFSCSWFWPPPPPGNPQHPRPGMHTARQDQEAQSAVSRTGGLPYELQPPHPAAQPCLREDLPAPRRVVHAQELVVAACQEERGAADQRDGER